MLSYLHQYHAGNFADLHKHLVLTKILGSLQEKDKPFMMIDSHAGEGYYPLSPKLSKNYPELQSGLAPFFDQVPSFIKNSETPPLIRRYCQLLQQWNPKNSLGLIPGSPLLLSHYLRQDSTLMLCEKHPSVFVQLQKNFPEKNTKLSCFYGDGYQKIKALLPPKEKRGLIFIDPSYEEKLEYTHISECLTHSIKRFSTGIYVIWYPILTHRSRDNIAWLIRQILKLPISSLWQHEWHLSSELEAKATGLFSLIGSGLLCIHLPWQADQQIHSAFDFLNSSIFPGRKIKNTWLKQAD